MEKKLNYTFYDNGAGFWVEVEHHPVVMFSSLGKAWEHIRMLVNAGYGDFTVGKHEVPAKDWVDNMERLGFLD